MDIIVHRPLYAPGKKLT